MNVLLAKYATIEGERLNLRPVRLSDTKAMNEYTSHAEAIAFLSMPAHESIAVTEEGIAGYFCAAPLGKYGLELKATGEFIGTLDIRVVPEHKQAEIGYALNPRFRGKGYMTEAAAMLLKVAFEIFELERVDAICVSENNASSNVMKRLGMQFECRKRRAMYQKETWYDVDTYAILREDYFAQAVGE